MDAQQMHRKSLANRIAMAALAAFSGVAPGYGQVHPSFTMENIRPAGWSWPIGAFDFLSDGTMAVAAWKDPYEIFLVKNATGPKAGMTVSRFATGLVETLGLKVLNDSIYILQKEELTLLLDHDKDGKADEYRALAYDWTKSPNEKEYARGLAWDGQFLYGVFDGTTVNGGTAVNPAPPGRQNGVLKWTKTGEQTIVAGGMRVPLGIAVGPEKSIWVTDNQGGFRVSSPLIHIKQGGWYGRLVNPPTVFQPTPYKNVPDSYDAFAVNLEYDVLASSPGNLVMVPAEMKPYGGQLLVADACDKVGGVRRVFVERIGENWQGAAFQFSKGFEQPAVFHLEWGPDKKLYAGANGSHGKGWGRSTWVGLDRMSYKGNETFEMLAIRNRGTTQFEIEFTHPINKTAGQDIKGDLTVTSWTYTISSAYGGSKQNNTALSPVSAVVNEDMTKVLITFPAGALKLRYDHNFKVNEASIKSAAGKSLYTTVGTYTLSYFGPGQDPNLSVDVVRPSRIPVQEWGVHDAGAGMFRVSVVPRGDEPYSVRLLSLDGKTLAQRSSRGSDHLEFDQSRLPGGLLVVRLETRQGAESRTVFNGRRIHSGKIR